ARAAAAANAAHAAAGAEQSSASPGSADGSSLSAAKSRRRFIAPLAVGAAALTTAIVGSALVGSVGPDYDRLKMECAGMCAPSRWSGLEARANAGYALWGVAGALAIADVVLWVVELRA